MEHVWHKYEKRLGSNTRFGQHDFDTFTASTDEKDNLRARLISPDAISRVEQLSPVPYALLTPHLDTYPNAGLMWAQEEPINNGAWSYMQPRLETAMEQTEHHKGKRVKYAGRAPTSSVATGKHTWHCLAHC